MRGVLRLVANPIRFDGVGAADADAPPRSASTTAPAWEDEVKAADRWREQLAAWAIPEEIIAAAPESPWGFSSDFPPAGEAAVATRADADDRAALEALPEGGTVLDVGVGGGATSLPLAARAGSIVGVDAQADMLDAFRANAGASRRRRADGARVVARRRRGQVELVDVVVVGHVVYNVSELEPFVRALDAHARHRVVLELTQRHPLVWMRDLWMHFHDLDRPTGPTADDARGGAHASSGSTPSARIGSVRRRRQRRVRSPGGRDPPGSQTSVPSRGARRGDRRALGDRLREIDGSWDVGPAERTVVTLWWDTAEGLTLRPQPRDELEARSTRSRCRGLARRRAADRSDRSAASLRTVNVIRTGRNATNPPKS